ncbi:hypothetical protein BN946_scf184798.g18 [Trametes cinnabarina]|uniref:Uncharacterized protein n=1 Tax=Pycnoporus cinnabarinus TaxID=5643 RepID=A0A060SE87_PYCCI|nr:hypothetical protein BN946_scf184798.g18 [Trametes cinnabarina]
MSLSLSLPACLQPQHAILLLLALLVPALIATSRRRLPPSSAHNTTTATQLPPSASKHTPTTPASLSDTTHQDPAHERDQDMLQRVKQPYDAFLVLDVEATCVAGAGFDYPNEIIEWPVVLLRWKDKDIKGKARQLEAVDEFRSFVRPTWRPKLSQFCTTLTGITQVRPPPPMLNAAPACVRANDIWCDLPSCDTLVLVACPLLSYLQDQVDSAPSFPEVLHQFRTFLEKHRLIDPESGRRLTRFCFCTDGPYDIRDFVVKQCFISKADTHPSMAHLGHHRRPTIGGRMARILRPKSGWRRESSPGAYAHCARSHHSTPSRRTQSRLLVTQVGAFPLPRRVSLSIPRQLHALGLEPFEGRQHSGIDDTRNIARLVVELARRGWRLEPNTAINPNRRWPWMGRRGRVLAEYYP